jgi:NAD(P)-dependent dehydrogenase (short-subunit alcohol dehydrogenase family)
MNLVGYTEVIHALASRLAPDAGIVLFGGLAKERPYPGSTTVTTVNGAVSSMIRTLARELAPVRVNAIHPGVVGDSPAWIGKSPEVLDGLISRTPIGRLATMDDVADATLFLLDNQSVNGVNLDVDGGWLLT